MGWGTDFKADVFLNKEIYRSQYELDDKIKEIETDIHNIRGKILMYSSSNIKDIIPEDWTDEPIDFVYLKVSEQLNELEETIYHHHRLILYKDSNPDFDKNKVK